MANSPGWKLTGPSDTQMRLPLISRPTIGQQRQQQQDEADEAGGVAVALELAGVADHDQRAEEGGDAEHHPHRLQAGEPVGLGLASSRRTMNT